jgi:hypothetical protein
VKYFFEQKNVLDKILIEKFVRLLDVYIDTRSPTKSVLPNLQYGIRYDHVKSLIGHLIGALIGPHKVTACFLQRTKVPLRVHSDYSNNDNHEDPYYAVLFPLRFDGPCSTVVFQEKGIKSPLEIDPPKTYYKYTNDEVERLQHNKDFVLRRLSNPKTIKWQTGNAIIWDRRHFHCSDNFKINETTFKDSLVLFTTRK